MDVGIGCDKIVTIFESVQSKTLYISNQNLSSGETRALVQAMETHVELVRLGYGVTLDIEALTKYSGQGKCRSLDLQLLGLEDIAAKIKEHLGQWCTENNNWIIKDYTISCVFLRE